MDATALVSKEGLAPGPGLLRDETLLREELIWARTAAERLLEDPNDADDIVQEAWIRTQEVGARFESRGRMRAWLLGVVRRMARDTLRARRRRTAREQRVARQEARADAEDVVERSAQLERLLRAVRELGEPQRSAMLLRYLDGHSTAEIAAATGVSEAVVRKRLTRARDHLRLTLGIVNPAESGAERRGKAVRNGMLGALSLALLVFLALRRGSPAGTEGVEPGASGGASTEIVLAPDASEPPALVHVEAEPVSEAPSQASEPETASSEPASSEAETDLRAEGDPASTPADSEPHAVELEGSGTPAIGLGP